MAATILAGVGAATSIFGGILGSNEASKQNKKAEEAQKEAVKQQETIAKKTNKYNKKVFEAEKADYYAMQQFAYASSVQNWQQGVNIVDFEYLGKLKEYQKSTAIGNEQLGLNKEAMDKGIQAEQDALDEAYIQYNFDQANNLSALKAAYFQGGIDQQEQGVQLVGIKSGQKLGQQNIQNNIDQLLSQSALQQETAMVENLVSEGKIQLGQAGKSSAKAVHSNKAALQRSLMALDLELSGKKKQAAIQLAELNVETSLAEIGVGINLAKIDNAIQTAKETSESNQQVLNANLESQIKTTLNNIEQIELDKKYADVNTNANMMIMPEKMPYDPPPLVPPEKTFIKPMKAIPGYVPPAKTTSTWAPIIQGVSQAAQAMANPDFYKP